MNIYDVVIQRRRALKDLFDSANRFMEPTEREKMLMQHKNDLEKMAIEQKNDLDMYELQATTDFAQDMAKSKLDFDESMLDMGLKNFHDRKMADLKYNRDLELERMRQREATKNVLRSKQDAKDLIKEQEKKQEAEEYIKYISEAPNREELYQQDQIADFNLAFGDEDYTAYQGGMFGGPWSRFLTNVAFDAGSMATTFAGATFVAGQLGPQALVPEELITVPGAAIFGGGIGTINAFTQSFGGDGLSANMGIGVEEFGWIPKKGWGSNLDFSVSQFSVDKEKTEKIANKLYPNRANDPEQLKGYNQFLSLAKIADFDANSVYEHSVGAFQATEQGNVFVPSRAAETITARMAKDRRYMFIDVEFGEGEKNKDVEFGTANKLSLPYNKAVNDQDGVLWGNYDAITERLGTVLSERNILLVEAYLGTEKAGHMRAQRDLMLKYKSDYEQYFKDGWEQKAKDGNLVGFSRVQAIVNP